MQTPYDPLNNLMRGTLTMTVLQVRKLKQVYTPNPRTHVAVKDQLMV